MIERRGRGWRGAAFAVALVSVGRYDFEAGQEFAADRPPDGLSGIAWREGDRYLAVSDRRPFLYPLAITLDPASGAVTGVRMEEPLPLRDRDGEAITDSLQGPDREGIVWDGASGAVWIANERTAATRSRPSLARHRIQDGRMTDLISATRRSPLAVFQAIRINQGFESLARAADGSETWTCNEGALTVDAAPGDSARGETVRLVRFDRRMKPAAQYAYRTDPPEGRIAFPPSLAGHEGFGVSDLLRLDDGALLVLERGLKGLPSGLPETHIRLYRAEVEGATDVSRGAPAAGLAGRSVTPVRKQLLLSLVFPIQSNSNFEGMTLGPPLANGDRSLLLIADNDSGRRQSLYALRLRSVGP